MAALVFYANFYNFNYNPDDKYIIGSNKLLQCLLWNNTVDGYSRETLPNDGEMQCLFRRFYIKLAKTVSRVFLCYF